MQVRSNLYRVYQAIWRPLFAPTTSGMNVFSQGWDLLVILDGCRVDSLREVADEFYFVDDVASIRSVGSQSKEWLAKTFVPEYSDEIGETAYVTANVYTDEVFGESDNDRWTNPANWTTVKRKRIGELIELWRNGWNDELDTVPPKTVTDAAISTARQSDMERMIVHYMQPHEPFIAGDEPINDVWVKLRKGKLDKQIAREHYLDNLRLVLRAVETLLKNVDAPRTVLTSDHGNAFGEWGIFGHPIGFQHPVVKNVPWVETEAVDRKEYRPEWIPNTNNVSVDVGERLEALGYR